MPSDNNNQSQGGTTEQASGTQTPNPPASNPSGDGGRSGDDLIPRRILSEAQTESKKRKEKIRNLKAELQAKDAEIGRLKGLETKVSALSGKIQEAEINRVLAGFGTLDDEAKGLIKSLISPHIRVNADTFEVTKVDVELEKVKKVFGKGGESKPPENKLDDVITALYKRNQGKTDPPQPKAKPLDSLRDAGNRLAGKS
jgi:hypothetical protein